MKNIFLLMALIFSISLFGQEPPEGCDNFIIFDVGLGGSNYPLKAEAITVAPSFLIASYNNRTMIEKFRDIKGYEGLYQVSNLGRIKSLAKRVNYSDGRIFNYPERIMKQKVNNKYHYLSVSKLRTVKNLAIHRLVYQAFVGELINGMHVDHIDHNQSNNMVDNLQQITCKENNNRKPKDFWVGTRWRRDRMKWSARIKGVSLGHFDDRLDARLAVINFLNSIS